jgi:hypothetical protein
MARDRAERIAANAVAAVGWLLLALAAESARRCWKHIP